MCVSSLVRVGVLGVTILATAQPGAAQGFLMPQTPERGISVELSHPSFKIFDVTMPTSVWFVAGQMPLRSNLRGVVDLPLAHAEFKGTTGEALGTNTVLGNPYLGIEYLAAPGVVVEVGARLPLTTADEESFADVIGLLSDMDRAEAFLEHAVPFLVRARAEHRISPAVTLQGRVGATTSWYTGDLEDVDAETFVDYGVFASWALEKVRLGGGMSGRWHASADEGNFGERSLHQFGLTADTKVRNVRPGVSLRLPVDKDYREVMKSSVGVYVQIPIP